MRTLKFKFISPEGYEGKSYSRLSPWFVDGHFKVYLTLSWLTVVSKLNLKKQRGVGGGVLDPCKPELQEFWGHSPGLSCGCWIWTLLLHRPQISPLKKDISPVGLWPIIIILCKLHDLCEEQVSKCGSILRGQGHSS